MISRIILIAVTMATLTTIVYLGEIGRNGVDYARTVAFHVIVVMQWSSALCYRSDYETLFIRLWRFSPTFLIGLFIAVILQTIAMSGAMGGLLHLASISLNDVIKFTLVAFLVPIVVVEVHKWVGRHFFNKGHNRKIREVGSI
jgi:magnesium-transporting ATPase (P-type)